MTSGAPLVSTLNSADEFLDSSTYTIADILFNADSNRYLFIYIIFCPPGPEDVFLPSCLNFIPSNACFSIGSPTN